MKSGNKSTKEKRHGRVIGKKGSEKSNRWKVKKGRKEKGRNTWRNGTRNERTRG